MSEYLIHSDFTSIRRVDRDTEFFWMTDRDGREDRCKKAHGDMLFYTFEEAKRALAFELECRLERARHLDPTHIEDGRVSILFPLVTDCRGVL